MTETTVCPVCRREWVLPPDFAAQKAEFMERSTGTPPFAPPEDSEFLTRICTECLFWSLDDSYNHDEGPPWRHRP
jgi:hypothetical protein